MVVRGDDNMLKKIKEHRLQKRKEKDSKYYDDEIYKIEDTKSPIRVQMLDDGIKYSKNQQWLIAYYVLLIQGAIVAFHKTFKELNAVSMWQTVEITGLIIASIATVYFGYKMILNFSEDMRNYRIRINKLLGMEKESSVSEVSESERFLINSIKIVFVVSSALVILYLILSCFY